MALEGLAGAVGLEGMAQVWAQTKDPPDVVGVLNKVQAQVFQRRLRVKDKFRGFDPLRSGRCTAQQFVRAVNQLVPTLPQTDAEALASRFSESAPASLKLRLVNYQDFARSVDEVFALEGLERDPMIKVPRPGAVLHAPSSRPPANSEQQADLGRLLHRLALLTQTRGLIFKTAFQDCERSDAASLLCPRNASKVTIGHFKQYFPLLREVTEQELKLLIEHYKTESGDVHYLALHQDMEDIRLAAEAALVPPRPEPLTARGAGGFRNTQESRQPGEAALEKVRAAVAERRLLMHGLFQDFDRLRRGVCRPGQLPTVLAILNIELSGKELEALTNTFLNHDLLFCYRDFCLAVAEAPLSEPPESPEGRTPTLLPRLPPAPLTARELRKPRPPSARSAAVLEEVEVRLAKRLMQRRLALRSTFQDFDPIRTGLVTRNQFLRIMAMNGMDLGAADATSLCKAYCDVNQLEFRYLDFCDAIEARTGAALQAEFRDLGLDSRGASRYFDRGGEVIPLSSRTPRPFTH